MCGTGNKIMRTNEKVVLWFVQLSVWRISGINFSSETGGSDCTTSSTEDIFGG